MLIAIFNRLLHIQNIGQQVLMHCAAQLLASCEQGFRPAPALRYFTQPRAGCGTGGYIHMTRHGGPFLGLRPMMADVCAAHHDAACVMQNQLCSSAAAKFRGTRRGPGITVVGTRVQFCGVSTGRTVGLVHARGVRVAYSTHVDVSRLCVQCESVQQLSSWLAPRERCVLQRLVLGRQSGAGAREDICCIHLLSRCEPLIHHRVFFRNTGSAASKVSL